MGRRGGLCGRVGKGIERVKWGERGRGREDVGRVVE